jgi:hypothetical protein
MLKVEIIQPINDRYKLVNGIYRTILPKISVDIHRTKHPYTCNALFRFIDKVDTMVKHLHSNNSLELFYPNQILFRSVIEHFLVGFYIGAKSNIERSDTVAKQFYNEYIASEIIKRTSYDLRLVGDLNKIDKNDSLENIIKSEPSLFQNLTESERQRVHKVAHQFDIKYIIKYLIHEVPSDDLMKQVYETLPVLLNAYNLLSSFVHGGVMAEYENYLWFTPNVKETKMSGYCNHGKLMTYLLKETLLIKLVEYKPEEYYWPCQPLHMFLIGSYSEYLKKHLGVNSDIV